MCNTMLFRHFQNACFTRQYNRKHLYPLRREREREVENFHSSLKAYWIAFATILSFYSNIYIQSTKFNDIMQKPKLQGCASSKTTMNFNSLLWFYNVRAFPQKRFLFYFFALYIK